MLEALNIDRMAESLTTFRTYSKLRHVNSRHLQQVHPFSLLQGSVHHVLDLRIFHGPAEFSKPSQPDLEVLELMLAEQLLRSEFFAALVGQLELVDIGQPRRQGVLIRIAFLGEDPR